MKKKVVNSEKDQFREITIRKKVINSIVLTFLILATVLLFMAPGVITPIVVHATGNNMYYLIALSYICVLPICAIMFFVLSAYYARIRDYDAEYDEMAMDYYPGFGLPF